MCRFVFYMVPVGPPYYATGPVKSVAKCEEHDFAMDYVTITEGDLCPIGRIERAVDDGLTKIAAALK